MQMQLQKLSFAMQSFAKLYKIQQKKSYNYKV